MSQRINMSQRVGRAVLGGLVLSTVVTGLNLRTADAQNVNRKGSITFAGSQSTVTLDPHKAASSGNYPWILPIYDRLTQVDYKKNIKPMLATKWAFSADGLKLSMDLRKGVTFNDGTPLTADAVKVSIERAQTVVGSVWKTNLAKIASITIVNPYSLVFNLSDQSGDLPALFSTPAGAVINPKTLNSGKNIGLNPGRGAGSGPFVLSRFRPGTSVELVRADDDYWDPAANTVAKMTLQNIPDDAPRMSAFRTGQADVMQVRLNQHNEATAVGKEKGNRYSISQVYGNHLAMYIRSTRSEFDKVAVRQAVNYAIDRSAIGDDLFGGACDPTAQMFAKGDIGYAGGLDNAFNYDPPKARRLLESAGLKDGFSFTMTTPDVSPYPQTAAAVKEQLAKVGIRARIEIVPVATGTSNFNAGGVDAYLSGLTGTVDPGVFVDQFFVGGSNLAIPAAPEVRALATKGKDRTQPAGVWQQAYRDIAGVAATKALYVPICFSRMLWLSKDYIGNVPTMPWQSSNVYDPRYLTTSKG